MTKQRVFFFDLLRCIAAIAVISIHVLEPYRDAYMQLPFYQWAGAVTINSFSRWAVPVFILISGALLLSDQRPFNLNYYVKRRLGKVLVPFLVWSLFYAYLSGWSAAGFDGQISKDVLSESYHHATYYHLGFFYYFIPLYLLIPFFQILVRRVEAKWLYLILGFWLFTSLLFLIQVNGFWSNQYYLYSGYLLLGYVLYQKMPLTKKVVTIFTCIGIFMMGLTAWGVISATIENGEYTIGRWLSYKTINTVLIASMVFMLGRYFGEGLSPKLRRVVGFVSTYSLGIYILHPLFLWPVKAYGLDQGNPLLMIPFWVFISGCCALTMSWLLSKSSKTSWLLP